MAVSLGGLVGLGLLFVLHGVLGRQILTGRRSIGVSSTSRTPGNTEPLLLWAVAALVVAVVVYLVTGWWVAGLALAGLVMRFPRWRAQQRDGAVHVQRTQAVASWTEMIRDNMAGAAGLEQALQVSASLAPKPIERELERFGRRLERDRLDAALVALGADLANPAADLVVAALLNAAQMEVRDLGPLLSRLADATRSEVRMRQRVEVGRAKIRTSARIVVVTTMLTVCFLSVFSRQILTVYDSFTGQLWMVVVAGVFLFGGWLLRHYGQLEMPPRFVARRPGEVAQQVAPLAIREEVR